MRTSRTAARTSGVRAGHGHGDDGIAVVVVIGTMSVVMLFLLASLTLTLNNTVLSRRTQDSRAAVAAAQAGIDEYVSRLNADSNYWANANVDATNPAFTAAGAAVPGTTGAGRFTYRTLNAPSQIATSGLIRLQVTGWSAPGGGGSTAVGAVSRTLTASLKPKGFLRYIYFSDVEVLDPTLVAKFGYVTYAGQTYWQQGTYGTRYRYADVSGAGFIDGCGQYYYTGRSSPSFTATGAAPVTVWDTSTNTAYSPTTLLTGGVATGFACTEIQWGGGDVVKGPLHSNDALQLGGPVLFTSATTESSWSNPPNSARRWWSSGYGGTPSAAGYWPVYGSPLGMPAANSDLLRFVEPRVDVPGATPGPGCYYTGQTKLVFHGTTMDVTSPRTTGSTIPARCYDTSRPGTTQTVTIPPVIYIDSTSGSCTYGALGYPMASEKVDTSKDTDYACIRGTALVKGSVGTQVTIAAKDDVVVVGDLTDADGMAGTDVVGLVAGNYVWVYHPVDAAGNNLLTSAASPHNVQAAILSLRHSFIVQNWNVGAALSTSGTTSTYLNVTGSIAQKFRGPVATTTGGSLKTGYLKNYVYDNRLATLQPPYFLTPTTSPWAVTSVTDG